ncbi:GNAT family N-acetyltransferase [Planomicrobium sp. CPCC 101110]|uniref:GNAT family N-acetyltransferase n=1 Tax=Planomicrobium sp. CPCC 101110 TaxID=2599619 RepID=UPI0016494281|nr:GNAT family N-acetyltransferase [Planomicrobium sp. CPCC 101110]
MIVRKAKSEEFSSIYKQGYKEWAKNRTFDQYLKDNQKEEKDGVRYVLVDDGEQITASLIMLEFRPNLFGIGSIVVDSASRGQGLGKMLIEECLRKQPGAAFLLYSEIDPNYYKQFGFRVLPDELQQSPKGVCMILGEEKLLGQILREPIPDYF